MNLNPWYAVAYRRLNQWVRRRYMKMRPGLAGRLWAEGHAIIKANSTLSDADRAKLERSNWRRGYGRIYRTTEEQDRAAEAIIDKILRERNEHA